MKTQAPIEESVDFARSLPRSKPCAKHMTGMRRVMTTGFREYFASKTVQPDTRETFCFAILAYLLRHVFTHIIYTHIL